MILENENYKIYKDEEGDLVILTKYGYDFYLNKEGQEILKQILNEDQKTKE